MLISTKSGKTQTSRLGTATKVNFSQIGGKNLLPWSKKTGSKPVSWGKGGWCSQRVRFSHCLKNAMHISERSLTFIAFSSLAYPELSARCRMLSDGFCRSCGVSNQTISPLKHSKRPLACVYLSYLLLAAQDRAWVLFQQWAHLANHLWTLLELTMNWEGKPQWDAKHSCNFLCLSSLHLREIWNRDQLHRKSRP